MRIGLAIACLLLSTSVHAQKTDPAILTRPWNATWISAPGERVYVSTGPAPEALVQYQVVKFRKSFDLAARPSSFVVHVSGDNRYKLFVNGVLASQGPARGDLEHWNFETVDIANLLTAGTNTLAALVWNEGPTRPEAAISLMTAFILQGNSDNEAIVNTNDTWKALKDDSYSPLTPSTTGYYVAGPGELIRMKDHKIGWEQPTFDDASWQRPRVLLQGVPKGVFTFAPVTWMLVPSALPQMEMTPQRMASVRKATGVQVPAGFPAGRVPLTVPARTRATLLIDNGVLTNAYPTIQFSGGRDAGISIAFAESLYIRKNEKLGGRVVPGMPKGNRNEIDGKTFVGRRDSIVCDGRAASITTLWYRTYRYVQLVVETREQPLVIEDLFGTFTGYPFRMESTFQSSEPMLSKNVEIGWRTARLCATETYMDCPYYEQLQYFGDTRIQALVTLFNSSDDRLVRNAIRQGDESRFAEGVTMSRYPTASTQIIPPFSLWWIGMIHDYYMYRDDPAFVKDRLPGIRQVLSFFSKYQEQDGSLKNLPYWVFTDWVSGYGWKDGVAPIGSDGSSAVVDLQLLLAYQLASELEAGLGVTELSRLYEQRAAQLSKTIEAKYWDTSKQFYADTREKDRFSQHTNALAILGGLRSEHMVDRLFSDTTLAPASIYFKYYLHRAGHAKGKGNDYLSWLAKWNENIQLGLTTWSEMSDVARSRSDCHAWGSSPNIEFYRMVLGIDSSAPGFKRVRIAPQPGTLTKVSGSIPHPLGTLAVSCVKEKGKWKVVVDLPAGLEGDLEWPGRSVTSLKPGKNSFEF